MVCGLQDRVNYAKSYGCILSIRNFLNNVAEYLGMTALMNRCGFNILLINRRCFLRSLQENQLGDQFTIVDSHLTDTSPSSTLTKKGDSHEC